MNPIERITTAAARIGADDLSQRIGFKGRGDEIARLAATFDHMLARLEAAFQRQRQFTADASHELRTPLAILTSQVDIALERPRSAAEYYELLTSIREDAGRMDQLLGQLLTLARADAGQSPIAPEHLSLRNLVDDVVIAMQPLAELRAVGLSVDPVSDEEVAIDGDQTRLTQLLMNLIDNGLKYTPASGTVTIMVRRDSQWALVEVADSGVGIPSEDLPHIFERFFRVDQARARAAGGSGLGLAISQWIVQAHGGEIHVESAPGRGTTVVVRLPLPSGLRRSQAPPVSGTGRRMPLASLHRRPKE